MHVNCSYLKNIQTITLAEWKNQEPIKQYGGCISELCSLPERQLWYSVNFTMTFLKMTPVELRYNNSEKITEKLSRARHMTFH